MNPSIKTGLLYNRKNLGGLSPIQLVKKYQAFSFHCNRWQVRINGIEECRKFEIPVYVYTVNWKRGMKSLIKMEVNGIFSDNPARLKIVSGALIKG